MLLCPCSLPPSLSNSDGRMSMDVLSLTSFLLWTSPDLTGWLWRQPGFKLRLLQNYHNSLVFPFSFFFPRPINIPQLADNSKSKHLSFYTPRAENNHGILHKSLGDLQSLSLYPVKSFRKANPLPFCWTISYFISGKWRNQNWIWTKEPKQPHTTKQPTTLKKGGRVWNA